jgi:hypothetical protein
LLGKNIGREYSKFLMVVKKKGKEANYASAAAAVTSPDSFFSNFGRSAFLRHFVQSRRRTILLSIKTLA